MEQGKKATKQQWNNRTMELQECKQCNNVTM